MIRPILLMMTLWSSSFLQAQTDNQKAVFQESLDKLHKAFDTKDLSIVKPLLSRNFQISGYNEPVASQVLQAASMQITNLERLVISSTKKEGDNFRVVCVDGEGDDTDYLLDAKGMFLEINLFKVQTQQASSSVTESGEQVTIPFSMMDKLLAIAVNVNDESPSKFILDTGASMPVLDSTYAASLGIKETNRQSVGEGGGSSSHGMASDIVFRIGENTITSTAVLADLSHLADGSIEGIIGAQIFQNFVVDVNYDKMELTLMQSINQVTREKGNAFDLSFANSVPAIDIAYEVGGESLNSTFIVDSGAGVNLLLDKAYHTKYDLGNKVNKKVPLVFGSLGKNANTSFNVLSEKVTVFNQTFLQVPIVLSNSNIGGMFNPDFAGVIGSGILAKYNQLFDYKSKKLYLQKNNRFDQPFDYPCAGFSIDKEGEKMKLISLFAGSDAEKSGLYEGAEILSVNGMETKSFMKIREDMQKDGEKIEVKYKKKDGSIATTKIKLKRLI